MTAAWELAHEVGVRRTTDALGVARASLYRAREPRVVIEVPRPRPSPPRTLGGDERQQVLALLNSARFVDRAPKAVYAELLDEDGTYLCSWRTMYRILAEAQEVRERRNQLRHPAYAKPELGHGTEPGVVVGHHEAAGAGEVDLLLPLCDPGHL